MPLRILSYNILEGGEERLPLIANIIEQQQPDLVALIEARNRANAEALAQHLHMHLAIGQNSKGKEQVACLSRTPLLHTQNHPLPILDRTLLEIAISWEDTPFTLFITHLKAKQTSKREQHRVAEIQAILEVIAAHQNPLHALVGDLNTIAPNDQPDLATYLALLRKKNKRFTPEFPRQVIPLALQAGYSDCYRTLHPTSPGYTLDTHYPSVRFDYILAAPQLASRLQECDVIKNGDTKKASDHFPIWAEFR